MKLKPTTKPAAGKPSALYAPQTSGKGAGWAVTDPAQFAALAAQSNSGKRAPELFLKDKEPPRKIRFVDVDAIVALRCYRLKLNGKFSRVIAPDTKGEDAIGLRLGKRPQWNFIFRVIDIGGYKDKEGKEHRNVPRFYVVGNRIFGQLQALKESLAVEGIKLNQCNVIIARSGSGTSTAYQFTPSIVKPLTPEQQAVVDDFPKVADYYTPPTDEEVRSIASQITPDDED